MAPACECSASMRSFMIRRQPWSSTGGDTAVLVLDGRGEVASHLAGVYRGQRLTALRGQELPHSLGLLYEDLTRHLGFLHSSDEYKVMALASYGRPRHLDLLRDLVRADGDGGFTVDRIDWASLAKPRAADAEMTAEHADLAASVQARLEEVLLVLADDGIVAWYQGRSEYGPRALGHRSLLAHPGDPDTTARMNDVKGREQFRPIAPMVRAERAAEIFDGVLPSPYMLFVHTVRPQWRDRIPAVVHVDGTARVQTVA